MKDKKIAVVTGAASGIGKAIADKLSANSYAVVSADIHQSGSDRIDEVQCDVTSGDDIDKLYRYVKDRYGIPDVLISNAGQGIHEKLSEGDPEKWKTVLDVNVVGALRLIRAFLPEMIGRKSGDIVFISSTAALRAYEYGAVYAASKAALNMIADTLRLEAKDLRISVVAPGVVDTPFFEHMISSNHTVEDIGLGSISPQQVADVVLNLVTMPQDTAISRVVITPKNQRV